MPNDPTIDVIDNQDLDLSGVPLKDPVADKQWAPAHITDLYWEQIDTRAGGKGKRLVIEVVTDAPVPALETDRQVPAGQKITDNIWATPSGKLSQDTINKKIQRFKAAALNLTDADLKTDVKFGAPDRYIGRPIKVYLTAEAGDKDPSMMFQRISRWDKA